ncbi:ATP-binding protein [Cellulosilyticum ruminicola]|uniref:ATP-binding protein n=1 Tax=Cellulosilyticum ruminicola TaxID=425254 RepID=UPI0006D17DB4|nr:ATP-binding protein [Cellulosilyticum ruminicola]
MILKIEDYGKGIAVKDLKYIRKRFYRSDLARNSKTGGTGLGMYIADEIIRLHEGEFLIASEVGAGTCITIKLKKN